jgi:2,3-diketo-5-methylthio-1-phosphopentane phosphatase
MPIPLPSSAQVWIDFDGTITRHDLLDDLVARHSQDESWKQLDRQWKAGKIGSRRCLQQQFALLCLSEGDLAAFLAEIHLDPGLPPLLELLDRFQVPYAVVSDGIDEFIHRTLASHNLEMPVRSNTIDRRGTETSLVCPKRRPECVSAASLCKCASMTEEGRSGRAGIYVGSGRSDLCPSTRAQAIFAKGPLADELTAAGRPFLPFETLLDVRDKLRRSWTEENVGC